MKKIALILTLTMVGGAMVKGHPPAHAFHTISIQTFYDELSPYGEWIDSPGYGFVWRPYLEYGDDFKPYYTRGNWVYTDFGWTWVSGYPWGWATFHYGRWFFDDYLGWMWIPGNQWAPAWVTWGSYDNCWAWAPMGPAAGIGMRVTWTTPHFWWTFVPMSRFYSRHWHRHCYTPPVHITNITVINNIYYDRNPGNHGGNWYYGPRVNEVEKHAGTRVQRMRTIETNRPGDLAIKNGRVGIYRPEVKNERTDLKPRDYRSVESARYGKEQERNVQRTTITRKEEQARPQVEERSIKQEARNSVNRIVHPTPERIRSRDESHTVTTPPVETRQAPATRVDGGSATRREQTGRENNTRNQRVATPPVESRQSPPARVENGSNIRREQSGRENNARNQRFTTPTVEPRQAPATRMEGGRTAPRAEAGRESNAENKGFTAPPAENRQSQTTRVEGGSNTRREQSARESRPENRRTAPSQVETRVSREPGSVTGHVNRTETKHRNTGEARQAPGQQRTVATPAGRPETKSDRSSGQQQRRSGGAN